MKRPYSPKSFSDFPLSNGARFAIETLFSHGKEAYLVGGAIRDYLLGEPIKDFDIATSATIEELESIFDSQMRIIPQGEKHGTFTLHVEHENIEITSFRSLHSKVSPTLEDDLSSRDLTINSLALGKDGLIDPNGGVNDLENGIIRFNSPMEEVVLQDPLRILRAIRFHVKLGFMIEEKTKETIIRFSSLLSNVAKERVVAELRTILLSDDIDELLFTYREVFFSLFPILSHMDGYDQQNPHHRFDLYTHTVHVVKETPKDFIPRFAALFHDVGKPSSMSEEIKDGTIIHHFYSHPEKSKELTKPILEEYRLTKRESSLILFLIASHDQTISTKRKSVRKLLFKIKKAFPNEDQYEIFHTLLDLQKADHLDHLNRDPYPYEALLEVASEIKDKGIPFTVSELNINGDELMEIGYRKKQVGKMLDLLLELTLTEQLPNEKERLIEFAKRKFDN